MTQSDMPSQPVLDLSAVSNLTNAIRHEVGKAVIGQHETIDLMLVALFSGGHILLEGNLMTAPAELPMPKWD